MRESRARSLRQSSDLAHGSGDGAATAVSRFGLAVRRRAAGKQDLGSNPLRLSFLFKSCGLWTLSCDFVPHSLMKH